MVFPGLHARTLPRDGDPLAEHARARVAPVAVSVVTCEQRAALASASAAPSLIRV
jgi:hypothetical protein